MIMNLKLIVAALAITAAVPIYAQAQEPKTDKGQKAQKSQKAPASKAPAPVNKVAAAPKVRKAISSDNAKKQTYCDIGKLGDQIEEAEQKKDMNKIDEL